MAMKEFTLDALKDLDTRPIPWAPGYRISSDGRVWSCLKVASSTKRMTSEWHEVQGWVSRYGYKRVAVCAAGKPKKCLVHALVLEAFVGPKPEGMECCHANGVRTDNRLENLRWDTRKGNMQDAVRHGTTHKGERSPVAKLTADQVREIRRLADGNVPHRAIAERFGVHYETVSCIKRRKSWKHIPADS